MSFRQVSSNQLGSVRTHHPKSPLIGNVGSPLQRLPKIRKLCLYGRPPPGSNEPLDVEVVAVPPRSYGLSTNSKPTQSRVLSDYRAVVESVTAKYTTRDLQNGQETKIVWYGHSLGASIATCLLDSLARDPNAKARCDGLIFENGFSSIKDMVRTLYPQKFLPYYWLTPFVLDNWDALAAFSSESTSQHAIKPLSRIPKLFVSSAKDEIVPAEMVSKAYKTAADHNEEGVTCQLLDVKDALHDTAFSKAVWITGITKFLGEV